MEVDKILENLIQDLLEELLLLSNFSTESF